MDKIKRILENPKAAALVQFIKFGIVGVSNTAISYGIDMLCFYVIFAKTRFSFTVNLLQTLGISADTAAVKTVAASVLAFIISVTNSYYWNNRFVFKSGKKSAGQHVKTYLKTVLCYGVTGLIISPVLKVWLVKLGVVYAVASLGSLVVTVPLNFILNKFWAFKKKG